MFKLLLFCALLLLAYYAVRQVFFSGESTGGQSASKKRPHSIDRSQVVDAEYRDLGEREGDR